jgi:hypothetical protein
MTAAWGSEEQKQTTGWMLSRTNNCVFLLFFTDLGKGEDPMEGGRGVLPPILLLLHDGVGLKPQP